MAQTIVYTCDVCKKSKDCDSLAKIEVRTEGIRIKRSGYYNPLKIEICEDCLKKKGFVVTPKIDDEEDLQTIGINEITLEDKFYEILKDMGVAFEE